MKNTLYVLFLFSIAILSFNCSSSNDTNEVVKIENEMDNEEEIGVVRNITASQLVADMEPGWNLGNSFDVRNTDKTAWGNPLPSTTLVDAIFNRGFKTLRLPVTWGYNLGSAPNYTIEPAYMARVTNIVDHALSKGMYVIVNIHHDDEWVVPTFARSVEARAQLESVWTQIASNFKDYSDFLIFELLNEPRHKGTPEEWTGGTEEGRQVLNEFYATSLNAIRRTGGNNEKRKLMIAPYAASVVQSTWDDLVIPNNDEDVIISLHAYFPFQFALDASDADWGTDEDKRNVDALMNRIETNFIAKGRPVVMGEWGSIGLLANAIERTKHAEYFAQACLSKGIVPVVWDDGGDFGLIDRRNFVWNFGTIADAAANKN